MKILAVATNFAVIVAMILIYVNHVHSAETDRLLTQIQIERAVASALINQ
jgi:hypothetical protein